MDFTPETSSQCVCAIYCNPSGYDVRLSAQVHLCWRNQLKRSISAPRHHQHLQKLFLSSFHYKESHFTTNTRCWSINIYKICSYFLYNFLIFRSSTLPELLALCKQHKHGRDGPSEDSAVALIWRRCPDTISYWQKLSWSIQHIVGQYLDHCLVNILDIVPG